MADKKSRAAGQGVGQGDGWGGPAKGGGNKPARAFSRENRPLVSSVVTPEKRDRKALQMERTQALEDRLYDLAMYADREETSVSAAFKLHTIYNGTPIARNINLNTDDVSALTDDEIRAELERLGGAASEAGTGDAASGMPTKPAGVLH